MLKSYDIRREKDFKCGNRLSPSIITLSQFVKGELTMV